ncbi:MAG: acetyl-CoA carboxylase biotin carboxyl carrier protein subunit, partial [Burkholderiaceae bacterium]|nr:acetyl-CoA carboxylase biotin carboxyl carrier protein subunit [Burkholderiaceae bacterium]
MVAGQGQGSHWLKAGVHGAVIGIEVQPGDVVAAGQLLLVQEAMKMEVPLEAPATMPAPLPGMTS